jgi:hypothetical protein
MALVSQQRAGQTGKREHPRFRLREYTFGHEVPQQPFQGSRIGPTLLSKLIRAPRTGLDQIRQPQCGSNSDGVWSGQVGKRTQLIYEFHVRPATRHRDALFRPAVTSCSTHCHYILPVFGNPETSV